MTGSTALRMIKSVEIENAVMEVVAVSGGPKGTPVALTNIEIAMFARGYGGRRVTMAIRSLIGNGQLRRVGPASVAATDKAPRAAKGARSTRTGLRRRSRRLANILG
ncbi:MAG TPA: hypothetical protein VJ890_17605 [Vineibacter sp.]|nr:hypothetical protein [Vineibacter sp.]